MVINDSFVAAAPEEKCPTIPDPDGSERRHHHRKFDDVVCDVSLSEDKEMNRF